MSITIRAAETADEDGIWTIFREVVDGGDTYTYDPNISREDAMALWFAPLNKTFVACRGEEIVGTYIIKPNQLGLGSHVANAGYMVRRHMQGKGIGRAMCEHSLETARQAGFQAMQFNIVVSTNTGAVQLWQSMGFEIVGTLPKAFRHKELGLVDAYVMHRFLKDPDKFQPVVFRQVSSLCDSVSSVPRWLLTAVLYHRDTEDTESHREGRFFLNISFCPSFKQRIKR